MPKVCPEILRQPPSNERRMTAYVRIGVMVAFKSGPVLAAGMSTGKTPFLPGANLSLADAKTDYSSESSGANPRPGPARHTASKRRKSGEHVPLYMTMTYDLLPAPSARPESCLPPPILGRQSLSSSKRATDWHADGRWHADGLLASQFPVQHYPYPDFGAIPHCNPQSDETIVTAGTSGWYSIATPQGVLSASSSPHSDWQQSDDASMGTTAEAQSTSSDVWPKYAHVGTARYVEMSASASPFHATVASDHVDSSGYETCATHESTTVYLHPNDEGQIVSSSHSPSELSSLALSLQ